MAYKDPDRQREAVKQATRRYRAKQGITNGITEGITDTGITQHSTKGITYKPRTVRAKDLCRYCRLPADQPSPQCSRH